VSIAIAHSGSVCGFNDRMISRLDEQGLTLLEWGAGWITFVTVGGVCDSLSHVCTPLSCDPDVSLPSCSLGS
jgi:hypothetical protein